MSDPLYLVAKEHTMFTASIIAVALVGQMIVPEVKYDKFNDTTSMRMNLGKLPDEEECDSCVAIVAFYPGKKPKIDSLKDDVADVDLEVRLAFYRHDGGQKYGASHEVKMMCGDERIPLSNQSYGFGPSGRHNGEIVLVEVDLPTLRKYLAEKKDWDVKIGRSEPFCLTADYRMGMLLFIRFLED